jgi:hypothetical protein
MIKPLLGPQKNLPSEQSESLDRFTEREVMPNDTTSGTGHSDSPKFDPRGEALTPSGAAVKKEAHKMQFLLTDTECNILAKAAIGNDPIRRQLANMLKEALGYLEDEYDGAPDSPTLKNGNLIREIKIVLTDHKESLK